MKREQIKDKEGGRSQSWGLKMTNLHLGAQQMEKMSMKGRAKPTSGQTRVHEHNGVTMWA